MTDEQLVAAINAGDAGAFEGLYFRHRDYVLRLARRFTGNDDDALDVMQETFAYLLRQVPGFELRARMTTYLWPVVRSLSVSARRRRGRVLAVDDAGLDAVEGAKPPAASDGGAVGDIGEALIGLSHEHRQVVLMRFVDDLDLAEIALLLEVPLGTVKSRLHTAIAKLRDSPTCRAYFEA